MLTYYLSFKGTPIVFALSFLLYVLGSITNHFKKLLTILAVCCYPCPPFLKKEPRFLYFCFEKRVFPKYPKNVFNGNSSIYFENIAVCDEPFTFIKKEIFVALSDQSN